MSISQNDRVERMRNWLYDVAEQLEPFGDTIIKYGAVAVDALVSGTVAARTTPGAQPKRPRLNRLLTRTGRVIVAGGVVSKPVSGSINLVRYGARVATSHLVHRRVTSKPSRFLMAATAAAIIELAAEQAKTWAAKQPRLQAIEALGLTSRLQAAAQSTASASDDIIDVDEDVLSALVEAFGQNRRS